MKHKGCLLLLLPLLVGARDPFLPVEDRCQTSLLAQWRYGGGTGSAQHWLGLLQDHAGRWRRVRINDVLPGGWRVHQLTAETITIVTGAECEPAQWAWRREGNQHDAKDKPATSADTATGRGGEKRTTGVAGR